MGNDFDICWWDGVVCIPIALLVFLLFVPSVYFFIIYFSLSLTTSGLVALISDSTEEGNKGPIPLIFIMMCALTWPVFWTIALHEIDMNTRE